MVQVVYGNDYGYNKVMTSNIKRKIVIGNWKMNLTVPESTVLAERLKKEIVFFENTDVVVCPSYVSIYSVSGILQDSPIKLGSQNLFYEERGNFTGEISPMQLRGFVDYAIVGHSERRIFLGEEDKDIARKVKAAVTFGITPIICVGETLQERGDGVGKVVATSQLEAALSLLTAKEVSDVVVAYEPVWSISPSDRICKPKDAAYIIEALKNLAGTLYGKEAVSKMRFIYGGSVDNKNAKDFLKEKDIEGFLAGGASLEHEKFVGIVKETEKTGQSQSSKVKTPPMFH